MTRVARITLGALSSFVIFASVASAQPPSTGTGSFDFVGSFGPATGPNGEAGRLIVLTGVISGDNFEPGICNPDPSLGGKCIFFTDTEPVAPGFFKRAHPGQMAFTRCEPCTIDGWTGGFTLKISYPNPNDINQVPPTGFTKFTVQSATGGLSGLQGQGTLDFSAGQYWLSYHVR